MDRIVACCGPPTASPRTAVGVLAETHRGAPMPRQDGTGGRAPTLLWFLECALVSVVVFVVVVVFHAQM